LKYVAVGIIGAIVLGLSGAAAAPRRPIMLVPAPRELTRLSGTTQLSASWRMVTHGDSADRYAASLLGSDVMTCFGWHWRHADAGGTGSSRFAAARRARRSLPMTRATA
jgi:hypothetical protein